MTSLAPHASSGGLSAADRVALEGCLDGPAAAALSALSEGRSVLAALGLPAASAALVYAQAYALLNAGRAAKAAPLFAALCILDGSRVDHWLGHGLCLLAAGDLEAADVALSTAQQIAPEAPGPAFHLSALALRRGDPAEAARQIARYDATPQSPEKAALAEVAARIRAVTGR